MRVEMNANLLYKDLSCCPTSWRQSAGIDRRDKTRISLGLDRTARRRGGGSMGRLERQKAPDRHPSPDGQTDRRTCLNGSNLPKLSAKCDEIISFWHPAHTHTHKAKPIQPRYAGCKKHATVIACILQQCKQLYV